MAFSTFIRQSLRWCMNFFLGGGVEGGGTFKHFGVLLLFRVLPNGGDRFYKLHEVAPGITVFMQLLLRK